MVSNTLATLDDCYAFEASVKARVEDGHKACQASHPAAPRVAPAPAAGEEPVLLPTLPVDSHPRIASRTIRAGECDTCGHNTYDVTYQGIQARVCQDVINAVKMMAFVPTHPINAPPEICTAIRIDYDHDGFVLRAHIQSTPIDDYIRIDQNPTTGLDETTVMIGLTTRIAHGKVTKDSDGALTLSDFSNEELATLLATLLTTLPR